MKKFIIKIVTFIFCVSLLILGFYLYSYFNKQNEEVKLPKKNIIIGDSNTRWSMDDHILKNYANYSVGGEIYLFAYTKLKIFDKNNKIDTLLLAFSPHNIINNMWWKDAEEQPIQGRMPAFYQNFNWEDHTILMKNLPRNYFKSIMKIGKEEITENLSKKKQDKMFRFGFYMPERQHNENDFKRKYYPFEKAKITENEIFYLNKIIKECENKNIPLIFIQTPKNYPRNDYKNYAHPEFYQYYHSHYKNIDFLDFSRLPMPKNGYYDMNHVSVIGAENFSHFLQKNGIKNLLNSKYNLKK